MDKTFEMDKPKAQRSKAKGEPMRKEALIRSAEGAGSVPSSKAGSVSSREHSPAKSSDSAASEASDYSGDTAKGIASGTKMFNLADQLVTECFELMDESGNLRSSIKNGIYERLSAMRKVVAKMCDTKQELVSQIAEMEADHKRMKADHKHQMLVMEKSHAIKISELKDKIVSAQNDSIQLSSDFSTAEILSEIKELRKEMKMTVPAAAPDLKPLEEGLSSLRVALQSTKAQLDEVAQQGFSYADVTRGPAPQKSHHAIIVASDDPTDSGAQLLEKIKVAVDARSTGLRVDTVRKVRDQKIVLSCGSQEESSKLQSRLRERARGLKVEVAKSKDPLVIVKGVLSYNTDEDVLKSLQTQNPQITGDIPDVDYRASVKYRRRTQNPIESNIILQVSPALWRRLTAVGTVHIDLQRRQVLDQSPLLQCSKCLGFGHGRKFCKEEADLCSHCGDPHLRKDCPAWTVADVPSCRNCRLARLGRHDHNAFDLGCPTRLRWDSLARSSVAYM